MSLQKSALFVCLGNICRSPIAEGVFLDLLEQRNLKDQWRAVDSAAVADYHTGKKPDSRALKTMKTHNITYTNRARQIQREDYTNFDYIFGMDDNNLRDIESESIPGDKAKIILLGTYDPEGERIIRDPYYDSNDKGFEKCYQQCVRSLNAFLDSLET